jgi:hypothetical protein
MLYVGGGVNWKRIMQDMPPLLNIPCQSLYNAQKSRKTSVTVAESAKHSSATLRAVSSWGPALVSMWTCHVRVCVLVEDNACGRPRYVLS